MSAFKVELLRSVLERQDVGGGIDVAARSIQRRVETAGYDARVLERL